MTLDVIRVWEQAQAEPSKVSELERLLDVEENAVVLASFIHERKERPEMLKLLDDVTLPKYLALPTDQRSLIEELRAKDPRYLDGALGVAAQINLSNISAAYARPVIDLYRDIHTRHALERVVERYIEHNPKSRYGPVPLKMWFQSYDTENAKNLKRQVKGKITRTKTPPAGKYYDQYRKGSTEQSFEVWVQAHLPKELNDLLVQMPYFTQEKLTIEQTVELYIKHNPTSRMGPVPLTTWFQCYDPRSGENLKRQVKGKVARTKTTAASKYYDQYNKGSKKQSFVDWVQAQLPTNLRTRLNETPYFTQEKMTIEQVVEFYIAHNPRSRLGPVPLNMWFQSYNPQSGENLTPMINAKMVRKGTPPAGRYYQQYKSERADSYSFEDWVQSKLSDDLRSRLLATPYFQRRGDSS